MVLKVGTPAMPGIPRYWAEFGLLLPCGPLLELLSAGCTKGPKRWGRVYVGPVQYLYSGINKQITE